MTKQCTASDAEHSVPGFARWNSGETLPLQLRTIQRKAIYGARYRISELPN
jgi:hypothetical protein